ncbi:MAG: leucine-rich repeat domain-containing protein, partial [Bacteroidaceae bacterium]|nr:leucine-rich repeat domain-containing protein [Bacteroidaceae bacterium]
MAEAKFTYEIISKEEKTIRIKQAVSVTEEVIIPEKVIYYKQEYTVTEIGDRAFVSQTSEYFTQLKRVIIPDNIKRIGTEVFTGCLALECVVLPDDITDISEGAFAGCPNLELKGKNSAENNGALIINGTLIAASRKVSEYDVPEGVTRIGKQAFSLCRSLTSITLPKSVTSIGYYAFEDCSIRSIIIPEGMKSIGGCVFSGCSSLKTITIPESVASIGGCA